MKQILFSAMLILPLLANSAELKYFNGNWAEAKAKAKAENKYIFLDCYTDWCGWCKVMDKETMTDEKVSDMLNNKFIPLRMEMEHGEGMMLAMKYHIMSFPTFLFFNPSGELVYETMGYEKPAGFLRELDNAVNKTKQFKATGYSSSLDIDFPVFYKKAFAPNGEKSFPSLQDVTNYLDAQKDLFSESAWGVMARWDCGEKYTKYFYDNIARYRELYGNASVEDKVNNLLGTQLEQAIKDKNERSLSAVLASIDKYVTDKKDEAKRNCRIMYYKTNKEWQKLGSVINEMIVKEGYENTDYINSLSWDIYKGCEDKAVLQLAAKWMKEVVRHAPEYANMDTYAALLHKCGQKKDAETWAKKAIEIGKKNGSDITATEKLLQDIRSAK